jgi:hypothetical protein
MLPIRNEPTYKQSYYVLPETIALVCVGGFDLIFTIYLLASGQAHEANPLMRNVLDKAGPNGFVLVKALFLAGPLVIAEIARRHKPEFTRWALRFCIVVYVIALGVAYNRLGAQRPSLERPRTSVQLETITPLNLYPISQARSQ